MLLPIELSQASALPCGRQTRSRRGTPTGSPERVHVRHAEARSTQLPLSGKHAGGVVLEESAPNSPGGFVPKTPPPSRSAGAAGPGLRSEFRGARAARKDPSLRAGGKLVQERDCAATPPTPPKNRPRGHRGAGYQRTPLRSGRRSTKAISASPVAFSSPK
ncbi:unnamed protein product [Rangifer tarandus platyrhynchus]|uniref:Uncharacterized protein n=1 Tax=Rangifer tarandus platyrhynchus TaxID=3082113 RepID=A0AC59YIX1_RANTA